MNVNDDHTLRSVVLIDDDADFMHVMRRKLQSLRCEGETGTPIEVHTFTDPVEALVNLPAEGICVVISDYSLPGSTAIDWLPKLIKADVGPIILMTSQGSEKIAAEAFRSGVSDYLTKSDILDDTARLRRSVHEAVHHYRLESMNRDLTRQLKVVNADLARKNERLHELTETATQFVDDVAHDFRTPLTVVHEFASLIAEEIDGPVTDKQKKRLMTICDASRELSEMVDDFLDSSKLRARTLRVDRTRHSIDELFSNVMPLLEVRGASKEIRIEQAVEPDLPPVFIDLSKATRVVTNFAVNALKVSRRGSVVQLWARATETGDVCIGVTDEGPGLSPDDLKSIFERFKQVGELQTTKGFGLGLSIARQLVWLNLGTIQVQSEVGKGSTFSFTVPADDLQRILDCYLQQVGLVKDVGDIHALRAHGVGDSIDFNSIRQMVAAVCHPMDLVLKPKGDDSVVILGISASTQSWIDRVRESFRRLYESIDKDTHADLQIASLGSWARDVKCDVLHQAVMKQMEGAVCHV